MEEVLLEVVCLSPYNLEMFSIAKVLASAKALNISKISAWTLCFSVAWLGCSLHTVSFDLKSWCYKTRLSHPGPRFPDRAGCEVVGVAVAVVDLSLL